MKIENINEKMKKGKGPQSSPNDAIVNFQRLGVIALCLLHKTNEPESNSMFMPKNP